ncbi:hypothetical protein MXB_1095, partial [Myxobolus squamalis]
MIWLCIFFIPGPLTSQIILSVLPLIIHHEEQAYIVLQKMLIENARVTNSYLHEVHIFSSKPPMSVLCDVIKKFWVKSMKTSNLDTLLKEFYKSICSDQSDVRKAAIINLSDFLLYRWYIPQFYLIDVCDKSILFMIFNQLLKCCADPHSEFLFEAGRCLGILGSIDYSIFAQYDKISTINQKTIRIPKEFPSQLDDFGIILLNDLATAFLVVTETKSQDCAAYAMQEIMQVYRFSNSLSGGQNYLKNFSDQVQEVLIPHLSSSYSSKSNITTKIHDEAIFGKPNASTFNDWIKLWCSTLIISLPDSFIASILKPCFAIVRYYVPIAKLLLPYVIVASIDYTSSYKDYISREISHILKLTEKESSLISESQIKAVETVFEVLNFASNYAFVETNKNLKTQLQAFVSSYCLKQLCMASLACKSYARSLKYLEQYISSQTDKNKVRVENLELFKVIYYSLNDYDGIIGTSRIQTSHQPDSSLLLQLEIEGRFIEAIACHEKNINAIHDSAAQTEILKFHLNLGQFQSLIANFDSLKCDCKPNLIALKMDALWRLGSWTELEQIILENSESGKTCVEPNIATVLVYLRKNDQEQFKNTIIAAYRNEAKNLSIMGSEAFMLKRRLPEISRLHLLFDIEMYARTTFHDLNLCNLPENIHSMCQIAQIGSNNKFKVLPLTNWILHAKKRLNSSEVSYEIREPLINAHRVIHQFAQTDPLSHNFWVCCSKLARKCGYYQTAFNYLLNAKNECPHNLSYVKEMTKFLVKTRSEHEALGFLKKYTPEVTPKSSKQALIYTDLKLMICKLSSNTSDCDPNMILKSYNEVISLKKNLEKTYFAMGSFFDQLSYSKVGFHKSANKISNSESNIIQHYGMSLKYGYKYLYQSMPRLITIWLDYPSTTESNSENSDLKGNTQLKSENSIAVARKNKKISEICGIMRSLCNELKPFVFLSVLPQLVSRICHQNKAVVKRCKSIFDTISNQNSSCGYLINSMSVFNSYLLELCNIKSRGDHILLSQEFSNFKSLINQQKFVTIMIPLLATLTCNIPDRFDYQQHSFFQTPTPMIVDINDRVDVLASLIRPKKIQIISSNGKKYSMLCKPKDDLRRDSRLMEFNSLVNKLLNKNAKARKRDLRICLYAVVPLNDECGIIEWVDNTVSYRSVVLHLNSEFKYGIPIEELKKLYLQTQRDPEKLLKLYNDQVLPAYPPVLQQYFYRKFNDASSWYAARQLYTRSAAVMSMVGYILGLGDRHGENILFVNTGEIVHVDFNCLFNKGSTFEWPEKVPFRLTHNMIEAMGSLGYESSFRSCCEITLDIMRSKTDSLIGVLSTFLHDPLVEWVKSRKNTTSMGEQGNEMALKMLQDVEKRLHGITPQSYYSFSLSVQGQVHQLIQEATSM